MKLKIKAKKSPSPLHGAPEERERLRLQGEFGRLMHAVDDVKRWGRVGTLDRAATILASTYTLLDSLPLQEAHERPSPKPKSKTKR